MREAEIQFCNPSNQSYQFQLCQITSKVIFHIGTRIESRKNSTGPKLFDEASLSSAAQLKANKVDQKTGSSYYFAAATPFLELGHKLLTDIRVEYEVSFEDILLMPTIEKLESYPAFTTTKMNSWMRASLRSVLNFSASSAHIHTLGKIIFQICHLFWNCIIIQVTMPLFGCLIRILQTVDGAYETWLKIVNIWTIFRYQF